MNSNKTYVPRFECSNNNYSIKHLLQNSLDQMFFLEQMFCGTKSNVPMNNIIVRKNYFRNARGNKNSPNVTLSAL